MTDEFDRRTELGYPVVRYCIKCKVELTYKNCDNKSCDDYCDYCNKCC